MASRVASRVPPELLRRGRVLRPVDAEDVDSNPRAEFARLERAGALHRLAAGLFAAVPDDRVGRSWRPSLEAVALGVTGTVRALLPRADIALLRDLAGRQRRRRALDDALTAHGT